LGVGRALETVGSQPDSNLCAAMIQSFCCRLDRNRIIASFLAIPLLGLVAQATPLWITLDGRRAGRIFEGVGALSAGASSRLLIDYPEPYRSQVLDFLFKPNYGASLQHLKVEIGGDVNSTDGCEPSHMHTRQDENYQRGYEWWLMKEAQHRNPRLLLDCLEWGAPAWIGNGEYYSQENADYISRFIKGAKRFHGLEMDYVGIWNETRPNMGWIKLLRRTLDRNGLGSVRIVAADDIDRWHLVQVMEGDPELARAIQVVGVHYPKYKSTSAAQKCGLPIWASEDGPWKGDWAGAMQLARQFNRNYILGRMTKTIIWSPVTCYYDNLPLPNSGLMKANSPWSGSYEVRPAVWATAHTTQFAKPGWKYLDDAGCALLPNGGSYVTLKSDQGADYSIIAETVDATNRVEVAFELLGGLSMGPVHVWRSDAGEQFVRSEELTPVDGRLTVTIEPGSIYSLTTTTGQAKGCAASPPRTPFPLSYLEDFESYATGATPRYFLDQAGIFEVVKRADGKGKCLGQLLDRKGIEWPFHLDPLPESILGDPNWADYEVSADALIEKVGFVSLFGRVGSIPQNASPPNGYWLKVDHSGEWELGTAKAAIAAGKVPYSANTWHRLRLRFASTNIKAFIDDKLVANLADDTYPCGMIAVGSGWHKAQFDNVSVRADPSEFNLAFGREASASSCAGVDYGAALITDGDAFSSRWAAAEGRMAGEWVEVDLGAPRTFNSATIKPFEDRVTRYKIQHWDGGEWIDDFGGENLGSAPKTVSFPPVTARRARLLIVQSKSSPSIWELEIRHRP
jgi:hypothetical protein